MRKRRFVLNTFTSLGYQLATIICGLILPNLILKAYGTEVNGLINSITQFLRVVCLSEFGITAVIQSSLYEPLSTKDNKRISEILTSSDSFFRKIALFLFIYVLVLCFLYPYLIKTSFDKVYVVALILILSFNSLAQYLFAFTNSQLLSADQRSYIVSSSDIIATITNTILCAIEINAGLGIHVVKLTTAIVYLIKPIITHYYVRKHYNVNRHTKYTTEPIKQKWNGVSQHIAYYIFTSTDVIVLTVFSTLSNVSIYSVYVLVLNGLKSLSSLFEHGIRSLMGEIWAKKEKDQLVRYFNTYEWFLFALSVFIFGCASTLIVPFVQVYTRNVYDANYYVPLFGLFITLAYLIQNVRSPYHTLIQSVGHYKETQLSYILSAFINIVISVAMVYKYGLIGVAIGTLIAGMIETVWQATYLYKEILNKSIILFLKLFMTYGLQFYICFIVARLVKLHDFTYISWIKMAIPVALIWLVGTFCVSFIFFKENIEIIKSVLKKK